MNHDAEPAHDEAAIEIPGSFNGIEVLVSNQFQCRATTLLWMNTKLLIQAKDILDQILYNTIHDICKEVHNKEKLTRTISASVALELHTEQFPDGDWFGDYYNHHRQARDNTSSGDIIPAWKTSSAMNINGNVNLVGNPLMNQKIIYCPDCRLPRLTDPPIGNIPFDPSIVYCPHQSLVTIPGHDVHARPFTTTDGRTSRRKQQTKKDIHLPPSNQSQDSTLSGDTPDPYTSPEEVKKPKPIRREGYPDVECKRCGWNYATNIYGRHLSKCMGIGGRASGRAAALKLSGEAARSTSTPPFSRLPTPLPTRPKRTASDFEDDDDTDDYREETTPKQKKRMKRVQDNTERASEPPRIKLKLRLNVKKEELAASQEGQDTSGNGTRDPSSESTHTL
jgi:hypothetical protein